MRIDDLRAQLLQDYDPIIREAMRLARLWAEASKAAFDYVNDTEYPEEGTAERAAFDAEEQRLDEVRGNAEDRAYDAVCLLPLVLRDRQADEPSILDLLLLWAAVGHSTDVNDSDRAFDSMEELEERLINKLNTNEGEETK